MMTVPTCETQFRSGNQTCAATLYANETAPSEDIIVMAHGFGATRHYGLAPFASKFFALGYDVLAFDYRHFGESEGHPRGRINVARQLADWHAGIAHARTLGYRRVVIWGTSFAGGHVLSIAAQDHTLAGVICQVPHTSGPATALAVPLAHQPRLLVAMIADALLRLVGSSFKIKAFGQPSELAAMNTPGAKDALIAMLPRAEDDSNSSTWRDYFEQRNQITALSLLSTLFYSPRRKARDIACPVLLQAGTRDRTTPFYAARRAALAMRDCEFRAHDADHFDVYLGSCFESVVAEQCDFLSRRIGRTGPRKPA